LLGWRKNTVILCRIAGKLRGNEAGLTLIEAVVALAILELIVSAFVGSLSTVAKATSVADEQATAESLARSQMEYVKTVDYVYDTTQYSPAAIPGDEDYSGYSATIDAEPLHDTDDGIQKIAVTIEHNDKPVITLEGYKVDR
jgi:type II secretory pathway pseudopilin PulG